MWAYMFWKIEIPPKLFQEIKVEHPSFTETQVLDN